MSTIQDFTITSKHDGLSLSVTTVIPDAPPRALVQFAHGMAEHKARYLPVMTFLAANGFACIINDHRGHGGSVRAPEDLGYFYNDGGRGLVRDLNQITKHFKAQYPDLPLILVGHSMGSLAGRAYAAQFGRDIDGLILSGSPGANPAAKAGLLLTEILTAYHRSRRAHSLLMDAIITGTFSKPFKQEGRFAWLSKNPRNVSAYETDPLCGFGFTINGYRALLKLMMVAYDEKLALRRNLPVHFMSGSDDPCAPDRKGFDSAVENIRKRGCIEVTSKMYPGLRHEIFNEGVQEVFDDLLSTIEKMIQMKG